MQNGSRVHPDPDTRAGGMKRVEEAIRKRLTERDEKRRQQNPVFHLGPDGGMDALGNLKGFNPFSAGSLRGTRPYFLLPVEEGPDNLESVRKRIQNWV